jgi:hypothetical protein
VRVTSPLDQGGGTGSLREGRFRRLSVGTPRGHRDIPPDRVKRRAAHDENAF